ncbi:type IV pilus assembly protein PilY1 [Alteromonadaceae bacterium Bs31]|nr:type IV pilus assembly protein PilY1 [Alteromonadaceae bacterium Bs31]
MNNLKRSVFSLCLVSSMVLSTSAAELNLADEPLFLGISTDPNVFFQLDDSGSMDWEILTAPYYHHCSYDRYAGGKDSSSDCASSVKDDGLWRQYYSGYRTYEYMYKNSDNAYSTGCTSGDRKAVFDCGVSTMFDRDWRGGSSDFNVVYYNPAAAYKPWAGTGLVNANFKAARSDPQPAIAAVSAVAETDSTVAVPAQSARSQPSGYSLKRDLTGFVYYVWIDSHGFESSDGHPRRGTNINRTVGKNNWVDLWDNHYKYTVNASSVSWEKIEWDIDSSSGKLTKKVTDSGTLSGADTDPNIVPARTVSEIQQNVANWYSYARRRSFVAKGAVGAVVSGSPSFRFGQTVINYYNTLFNEVPPSTVTKYSGYNQSLLNDLYSFNWPAQGTPLRRGLERAGKYIAGDLSGKTDPIIQSCQQNFAVLFTDGYWNGSSPTLSINDRDKDGRNNTVSDIALYFYDHDLDKSIANNVVPNVADPAEYQHMVTFPVAFGVTGKLKDTDTPPDGWPNPVLTSSDKWGDNPYDDDIGKIDDLWHAAFNSKGEYVAAQTPQDVVDSLTAALSEITSRDAASASVATSTGQISSSTAVFQAQFNSGDWSGRLYSYPLNSDDSVNTLNPNWQASGILDLQNYDTGRNIVSYNGSKGVKFRFPSNYQSPTSDELTSAQVAELLQLSSYYQSTTNSAEISQVQAYGEKITNYLRGERSNEGVSAGELRPRASVLGDIVDSDPKYVSKPNFYYPDSLETVSYASFRTSKASRSPMVYVGANDGMLHGFRASDGQELLAYVPSTVFDNLHKLADKNYFHRFFVNGAPTVVDAFYSNAWHTVLAGSLGRGGQGIFALDVTNPDSFSENLASSIVLWEFDDTDDADMGYSYSEPSIAKMANGSWAAVFGNGYNNTEADGNASTTGHGVLYIVDLASGSVVKKIDTGVGTSATPNGLSTPALVDIDNDYVVDYIYAGDIYGNMWKMDVSSSSVTDWDVAWVSGTSKKPLFTAASGQPITTRPAVGLHAEEDGQVVYFGTGKYIEKDDNNSLGEPTQGFYAIWDKNESNAAGLPVVVGDLLEQEIEKEFKATLGTNSFNIRQTSDNVIDWSKHEGWYMELVNQGVTPLDNLGERQVAESLLRNGRIIFPTNLPSAAPCTPGGTSWLMELDAVDGGRLDESPFDLNNDGVFSEKDYTYNLNNVDDLPASGIQSDEGIISTPGVLRDTGREVKYLSGSTGAIVNFGESTGAQNVGRQSWRELD